LERNAPIQINNPKGASQFFAMISEGTTNDLTKVQPSPRDSKDFCMVPGNKLPGYFRCIPSGLPSDLTGFA
jgi:hypothetical protein